MDDDQEKQDALDGMKVVEILAASMRIDGVLTFLDEIASCPTHSPKLRSDADAARRKLQKAILEIIPCVNFPIGL